MAMVINTNMASITAQKNLATSARDLNQTMERLSSGQRINSAADDAAGLAIRDKMTSQVEGLNQAVRNANDAISFMQSAEGALEETTNILQRMRTLAVQAVNDTYSTKDRDNLNDELGKLKEEIDRIGNTTSFNNKDLINGKMTNSTFQIGHKSGQTINIALNDMRSGALGKGVSNGTSTAESESVTLTAGAKDGDALTFTIGTQSHIWTADADYATANLAAAAAVTDWNAATTGVATGYTARVSDTSRTHTITLATNDTVATNKIMISDGTDSLEHTWVTSHDINNGTAATQLAAKVAASTELKTAIDADTSLSAKYTASVTASTGALVLTHKVAGTSTVNVSASNTNSGTQPAITVASTGGVTNGGDAIEFTSDTLGTAGIFNMTTSVAQNAAASGSVAGTVTGTEVTTAEDAVAHVQHVRVTTAPTADDVVTIHDGTLTQAVTLAAGFVGNQQATAAAIADAVNTGTMSASWTATLDADMDDVIMTAKTGGVRELTFSHVDSASPTPGAVSGEIALVATSTIGAAGAAETKDKQGITFTSGAKVGDIISVTMDSATSASDKTFSHTVVSGDVTTYGGLDTASEVATMMAAKLNGDAVGTAAANSYTATSVGAGLYIESDAATTSYAFSLTAAYTPTSQGTLAANSSSTNVTAGTDGTGAISEVNLGDKDKAAAAIKSLDQALFEVGKERSKLGAFQNRLGFAVNNMTNMSANTASARSIIADADYAAESSALAKNQILQQAGTAMLAQANAQAQSVLSLLK